MDNVRQPAGALRPMAAAKTEGGARESLGGRQAAHAPAPQELPAEKVGTTSGEYSTTRSDRGITEQHRM